MKIPPGWPVHNIVFPDIPQSDRRISHYTLFYNDYCNKMKYEECNNNTNNNINNKATKTIFVPPTFRTIVQLFFKLSADEKIMYRNKVCDIAIPAMENYILNLPQNKYMNNNSKAIEYAYEEYKKTIDTIETDAGSTTSRL